MIRIFVLCKSMENGTAHHHTWIRLGERMMVNEYADPIKDIGPKRVPTGINESGGFILRVGVWVEQDRYAALDGRSFREEG